MNTYRIHIRSDEFEYESEVHASNVEKEDGWTIFWNGNDVVHAHSRPTHRESRAPDLSAVSARPEGRLSR